MEIQPSYFRGAESPGCAAQRDAMVEKMNVLIETGGKWFWLITVSLDDTDRDHPPTVADTKSGNGRRWIRAQ